ncbi:MAG: fibronectin type III domain-containing protein [Verrucomicrobia bacterium]|nr:fibronectin type III domain-containing protein [Verrucomicrobiota bacterium]
MRQKAYNSVAALINAGTKLKAGAVTHATALGLTVGTEPLTNADLNGLTAATNAHLASQGVLRDRRTELQQAFNTAYNVAFNIRDTLKRALGRSYSPAWEGTGFSASLQIKQSVAGLEQQLRSMEGYLTDHAAIEVANVATAVLAADALAALTAANTAVTVQKGAVRGLLAARKLKEKTMRQRIRGVVVELDRVIGGLDGRWDSFGLNQPGIKQAPPKPVNVTVVVYGTKAVIKWDKTARAQYHRVWLKIVGVDEMATPVGSPADNNFAVENLASNAQFELSVSALNNGGESARSAVVVFQTA